MYTVFKTFDTNKQLSRTNPNTKRVRVRAGKAAPSQRLDPWTDMLVGRRTGDALDRQTSDCPRALSTHREKQ